MEAVLHFLISCADFEVLSTQPRFMVRSTFQETLPKINIYNVKTVYIKTFSTDILNHLLI